MLRGKLEVESPGHSKLVFQRARFYADELQAIEEAANFMFEQMAGEEL